jgi:hypothetical protein
MTMKDHVVLVSQVELQACNGFIQTLANLNLNATSTHVQNTEYMWGYMLAEMCTVFLALYWY